MTNLEKALLWADNWKRGQRDYMNADSDADAFLIKHVLTLAKAVERLQRVEADYDELVNDEANVRIAELENENGLLRCELAHYADQAAEDESCS